MHLVGFMETFKALPLTVVMFNIHDVVFLFEIFLIKSLFPNSDVKLKTKPRHFHFQVL